MARGTPQFATPPVTPVVKAILIASGVMFVLGLFLEQFGGVQLSQTLGFVPGRFVQGWIWQPFTYSFLHANMFHVLFNLLVIWTVGAELEQLWGWKTFAGFYVVCALGAALFHGLDNGGKVIVGEHHITCLFCNLGTSDSHSNSDVSLFECRGVVNTISSHSNDFALKKSSTCAFLLTI